MLRINNIIFCIYFLSLYFTLISSQSITKIITQTSYCSEIDNNICEVTFYFNNSNDSSSASLITITNDWFLLFNDVYSNASTQLCLLDDNKLLITKKNTNVVSCTFYQNANTIALPSNISNNISLPYALYYPMGITFTDTSLNQHDCQNYLIDSCTFIITLPIELTHITINTTSELTLIHTTSELSNPITFQQLENNFDNYNQYLFTININNITNDILTYDIHFSVIKSPISPFFYINSEFSDNYPLISLRKIFYTDIQVYPSKNDCSDPYSTTCTTIYVLQNNTYNLLNFNTYRFSFDTNIISTTAYTKIFFCPIDAYITIVPTDLLLNIGNEKIFLCQVWQKSFREINNNTIFSSTNGDVSFIGKYISPGKISVYFEQNITSTLIQYISPLEMIGEDNCMNSTLSYCTMNVTTHNYDGPKIILKIDQIPLSGYVVKYTCDDFHISWDTGLLEFTLYNTISSQRSKNLSNTENFYTFNTYSCQLLLSIDPSLTSIIETPYDVIIYENTSSIIYKNISHYYNGSDYYNDNYNDNDNDEEYYSYENYNYYSTEDYYGTNDTIIYTLINYTIYTITNYTKTMINYTTISDYTLSQRSVSIIMMENSQLLTHDQFSNIHFILPAAVYIFTPIWNYNYEECANVWSYLCTLSITINYPGDDAVLPTFGMKLPGAIANYAGIWDQVVYIYGYNSSFCSPSITVEYINDNPYFVVNWGIFHPLAVQYLFTDITMPILIEIQYRLDVGFNNLQTMKYPELIMINDIFLQYPLNQTNIDNDTDLDGNELNNILPLLEITFNPIINITVGDNCKNIQSRLCSLYLNFPIDEMISSIHFEAFEDQVYGIYASPAEWINNDGENNTLIFAPNYTNYTFTVHKPYGIISEELIVSAENITMSNNQSYLFDPIWKIELPLSWTEEAIPTFIGCSDPSYPYCDVTYDILNSYTPGLYWQSKILDGPIIMHEYPSPSVVNISSARMLNCTNNEYGINATSSTFFGGKNLFLLTAFNNNNDTLIIIPPQRCTVRWDKYVTRYSPPESLSIYMMGIVPLLYDYNELLGPIYSYIHWPSMVYNPLIITAEDNCMKSIVNIMNCTLIFTFQASKLSPVSAFSALLIDMPEAFPIIISQVYKCIDIYNQDIVAESFFAQNNQTNGYPLLLINFPSGTLTETRRCGVNFYKNIGNLHAISNAFTMPFIRYKSIPKKYLITLPKGDRLNYDDASIIISPMSGGGMVKISSSSPTYSSSQLIIVTYTFLLNQTHQITLHTDYNLGNEIYPCISSDNNDIISYFSSYKNYTIITMMNTTFGSIANQECDVILPHNSMFPTYSVNVQHDCIVTSNTTLTNSTYYAYATLPRYVRSANMIISDRNATTTDQE